MIFAIVKVPKEPIVPGILEAGTMAINASLTKEGASKPEDL